MLTAIDARMIQRPDEDHLAFASEQNRALYSFNIRDFHRIHTAWLVCGRRHSGIILSQQKRYRTGEQIRRLVRLIGTLHSEAMMDRAEFLGHW